MTIDQRELLQELSGSESWDALEAMIEEILKNIERSVLEYNLDQGSDKLFLLKSRYDGAKALAIALKQNREKLRRRKD